jgi:hypothetical protein
VLSRVPSEICAGRLCRGRERRSPSKSEREPWTASNGEHPVKHSEILMRRTTSFHHPRRSRNWWPNRRNNCSSLRPVPSRLSCRRNMRTSAVEHPRLRSRDIGLPHPSGSAASRICGRRTCTETHRSAWSVSLCIPGRGSSFAFYGQST